MRSIIAVAGLLSLGLTLCRAQVSVTMSQYNLDRTGANTAETILNTSNVKAGSFGKLFTRTVDDSVYALPLVVPNVRIAGGVRNVLFVATMSNTVYAFDADDPARSQPYWSVKLGTAGAGDSWIGPVNFGILSTPFIDVTTGTLYTVAKVRNGTDVGLYIYALDITTGAFRYNSPRRMSFWLPVEGVTLTNTNAIQRAGLLVSGGVLYVAVADVEPGDHESQEGFIQAFDARDLSRQTAGFQATPGATEGKGGIWEAGRGLTADAAGNIYAAIAGGAYDPSGSYPNYGSSIVKFSGTRLGVLDWFTPANWAWLFSSNLDPAANGVTLIPGTPLLFAGGKEGVIYLLNRNNMGRLEGQGGQRPVQRFQASQGCAGNTNTPDCAQTLGTAYWRRSSDGMLYVWDKGDVLRAYRFNGQLFETAGAMTGTMRPGMTGGPSISANGPDPSTAIVWAVTTPNANSAIFGPGTLRAFRADNIAQEIYNSDANPADAVGTLTKFAPPVVANGRVYLPTQSNSIPVYGLLCGVNYSASTFALGSWVLPQGANTYTQTITVFNLGRTTIGAPFGVALDNVPPDVTILNRTGTTSCATPSGSPYLVPENGPLWLTPGGSFSVTIRFSGNPWKLAYTTRVLAGSGGR